MALLFALFGLMEMGFGIAYGVREVVWMGAAFVLLAAVIRFLEPKADAKLRAMGAVSQPVPLPRRPYKKAIPYKVRGIAMLIMGVAWTAALVCMDAGMFSLTGLLFVAAGVVQTVGSFRK